MQRSSALACLVLGSCPLLLVGPGLAEEGAASPVEQVSRLADRIEQLREAFRGAQEANREDDARALAAQLRDALRAEQALLLRLRELHLEAKRSGRAEEARQLGRQFEEAVRVGEYARSLKASRPKPSPIGVVISRICYWPRDGESEWVELANTSDKPVDVSGWMLLDGQSLTFSLPEKLPPVPPKGFVLVVFDGTATAPTPFGKDGKAVVHTPAELKGDVLGDDGGHLALYAPGEFGLDPGIRTIRGYVAWGLSPAGIVGHALTAKCWDGSAIIPQGTSPIPTFGPVKTLVQGGAIALVDLDNRPGRARPQWLVFGPTEVSPGAPAAKPVPVPILADGTMTNADGNVTLGCVPVRLQGVRYQFQVCWDRACTQVFMEATSRQGPYHMLEKPVPPGKRVYWRVRYVSPDGTASPWSRVLSLVGRRN